MRKYLGILSLYFVSLSLFANPQVTNANIAQAYFDAYIERDWQTLASYLDEQGKVLLTQPQNPCLVIFR